MRATLLLVLLLAAPTALAHVDEGGETMATATRVALGAHEGEAGGADADDWFVVEVPVGAGLVATLTIEPVAELWLRVLSPDGVELGEEHVFAGTKPRSDTIRGGYGGGDLFVHVHGRQHEAPVRYVLTLEAAPMADVTVSRLDVLETPSAWGTTRVIEVELSNVGAATSLMVVGVIANGVTEAASSPYGQWIGDARVQLAPGASTTFSFPWNASGHVGDVRVVARARALDGDMDRRNDAAERVTSSFVEGHGVGVTIFDGVTRCTDWLGTRSCHGGRGVRDGWEANFLVQVGQQPVFVDLAAGATGASARVCTRLIDESACPGRIYS